MAYAEVVEEVASDAQRRLALRMSCALLATVAMVVPWAATPLPPLPHVSGMYGAATAMMHLATFWLLISAPAQPRSHAVIAAAYLFAGLMAVLHVLTFPGAVLPEAPVIGSPHAVSWLFVVWRAGFAGFIVWAVVVAGTERSSAAAPGPAPARAVAMPIVLAVAAVAAAGLSSQWTDIAALHRVHGRQMFSTFSLYGAYVSTVLAVAAALLIWRRGLFRRSIFVWLVFVLVAEAAGIWLSTFSGGRYTLAWYTTRVEGLVTSAVVLLLLARHFRQLQGDLAETVAVLRRRTDDLQAEIHRREGVEVKLAQARKLEAVGQLGAGLAHDLNNILQVLIGRLAILQRRAGSVADADVEVMRRNVRKAEALTRQLSLLSGRRSVSVAALAVDVALAEIADAIRPLLGPDHELRLHVDAGLPPVAMDGLELEIAVTNLVTNARDALPNGGRIDLSATRGADADGAALLRITVRDTGTGIAPEVLERVFEPFFTTKEPGKGTGLGLAQVYGFVTAGGGTVDVDSAPGRGTSVVMSFPLRAAEAPARAAMPVRAPQAGQVVLLVDDNDDVREASVQLLSVNGLVVRAASNAAEALGLLERGLRPDLLVSDIVMPGGMHGVELVRRARGLMPDLRVVLATGYSDVAEHAREEGYPVVRKPYDLVTLLRAVEPTAGQVPPASADS